MSVPNRYDQWLKRESDKRAVDQACDELDKQADHLAETTRFGSALRNYVEALCATNFRWPQA
jgi:hypothetical protein